MNKTLIISLMSGSSLLLGFTALDAGCLIGTSCGGGVPGDPCQEIYSTGTGCADKGYTTGEANCGLNTDSTLGCDGKALTSECGVA